MLPRRRAGGIEEGRLHKQHEWSRMMFPVPCRLFRSRDFVSNNTELMVLVTPYIVRAVAQKDLSRPDDGFADASDPQSDLLGNINRIYGVPGRVEPARNYRGTYGFITD